MFTNNDAAKLASGLGTNDFIAFERFSEKKDHAQLKILTPNVQ